MMKRLNSDGQQFYQCQQTNRPPITLNHWKQMRPLHMPLEIQTASMQFKPKHLYHYTWHCIVPIQ